MADLRNNPSLLPPNSSALERALEKVTARISAVPIPAPDIIDADLCPEALLPWLAWAFSVDNWKSYWPLHVKRARVRDAIKIQRKKGTANSVREVVATFGGAIELKEWWQQDPAGVPHTFAMVITLASNNGESVSAQFVDDVIAEVNLAKPVRSHFTFTQGVSAVSRIGVVAVARVVNYRRLQFEAS